MVFLSSFTGSDESPLSEGAVWSGGYTGAQSLKRASNVARVVTVGGLDAIMTYNGVTFSANQYAQAKVSALTTGGGFSQIKVLVRATAAASLDGYVFGGRPDGSAGNASAISKFTAGVGVNLASDNTKFWAANDIMKLVVIGNALYGYRNGVLILSVSDSSFTGAGRAGLLVTQDNAGGSADVDDFEAGDVAGIANVSLGQFPKVKLSDPMRQGRV